MNVQDVSVLVVDDESLIVDQLVFYLEDLGFNVVGYKDPEEALEQIHNNLFDVVMTDLKMPNISGMDIVKTIREKGDDTKVIIFTGFATADSAIDAIKHGVYSYIRKPYSLSEIRDTVTNAATQLYLQRENIALNNKIQNLYNYMTTLYDIISILYQVPDFDSAMEMVLDTLSEGVNAQKAGIFLKSGFEGYYSAYKFVGLDEDFMARFKYREGSTILGNSITATDTVVLEEIGDTIDLDSRTIENDMGIEKMMLVPIRYQEKLLGHIAVFDIEETLFTIEDYTQLLGMLATQIAPVMNGKECPGDVNDSRNIDQLTERILGDKIAYAAKTRSNVSIALLHLVYLKSMDQIESADIIKKKFQDNILETFSTENDIIWQSFNSVILVCPGIDQVSLDLECSQVKMKIEHEFLDIHGNHGVSVDYGIVVYPFDGKSAYEILDHLNTHLFTKENYL